MMNCPSSLRAGVVAATSPIVVRSLDSTEDLESMTEHTTTSEEVADAVIALLSVGRYSLERAWGHLDRLRVNGLLDPTVVLTLDEGEIVRRLGASGYDRGPVVTTMMGKRLVSLHQGVRRGALRQACDLLKVGKTADAERALCTISGVGPAVFRTFVALRSASG